MYTLTKLKIAEVSDWLISAYYASSKTLVYIFKYPGISSMITKDLWI